MNKFTARLVTPVLKVGSAVVHTDLADVGTGVAKGVKLTGRKAQDAALYTKVMTVESAKVVASPVTGLGSKREARILAKADAIRRERRVANSR